MKPEPETDKNHRQKPMKPLSATAAAKMAHKSKKDILESINKGDMTATKNKRGHWEIDPSELNRVFPYEVSTPNQERYQKPIKTDENTNETSALEVEVKLLREQLAERSETIVDLRARLDKETDKLHNLTTNILTDQSAGQGGKRKFFGLLKA